MRVIGYKAAEKRHDLTKLHNDLILRNLLDDLEKYKDYYVFATDIRKIIMMVT